MLLFHVGQPVAIHHQQPWKSGRPILLHGYVASFDGFCLMVERQFRHPGQLYDGLPAAQQPGDHGTIELRRDAWVSRRRYLRAGGELIGDLYNIQTPTRFIPGGVTYVDLEIDVAYVPNSHERVQIQDVKELEAAVRWRFIPEETARTARQVAEELAEQLRDWNGGSDPDWDTRPDEASAIRAIAALSRRWPGFLKAPSSKAA